MTQEEKEKIVIEAEKDIRYLIPALKSIYARYDSDRVYDAIRNLALCANQIKHACMRIMSTYDYIDDIQRTRDNELLI